MESENKSIHVSPSWDLIFQQIGKQLHFRSYLLAKRVILISLPATIVIFILNLIFRAVPLDGTLSQSGEHFINVSGQLMFFGTIGIVVVLIVTLILNSISKIEQAIWLDSHYDERPLTPQESWKIARKLYWAWSYVQFKIFYRYYLWVWASFLTALYLVISLFLSQRGLPAFTFFIFFFILGVGTLVYTRYLKIKLSYAPFLFLDRYDGERKRSSKFWREFFQELKELNRVSRGSSFKKNVTLEIGGDVAMTLAENIATQIQAGVESGASILPRPFGAVLGAVGTSSLRLGVEVAHRVIYFAKLSGRYVLYYYAFQNAHGISRHINEKIYSLK